METTIIIHSVLHKPQALKFTTSPRTIRVAAVEEKTEAQAKEEAPVGFTPPELDPNSHSLSLGGSTRGL
ncbi:putative photosystem I reaction center subunit II, chloroplastic-like [Sesbania bispinosa]|nr:putative photosystem I reaction center subunit II, chloroplastic-like [Sesbania bispinosa]